MNTTYDYVQHSTRNAKVGLKHTIQTTRIQYIHYTVSTLKKEEEKRGKSTKYKSKKRELRSQYITIKYTM